MPIMDDTNVKTTIGFLPSMLIGIGAGLAGCFLLGMAVMLWTH
jgi:hypothetical protein